MENLSSSNRNKNVFYAAAMLLMLVMAFKDALVGYPFNTSVSIRYIDDVIVFALYVWFLLDLIKGKTIHKVFVLYVALFVVFLFFHMAQTVIVENSSLLKYIFFIRDNFWYFPVFYFSVKYLDNKKIEKIILAFLFIQLVFVFFQIAFFAVTQKGLLWEDDINGSLGSYSSHILAYALVLCTPILHEHSRKKLLFLVWTVIVLASARSAILFYLISFVFVSITFGFSLKRFCMLLLALIVFAGPTFYLVDKNFSATLNPRVLFSQQQLSLQEGMGAARLAFLRYSAEKVDNIEKALIGHGSGSYSSRTAITFDGSEYRKFNKDFPFFNEFISGGSTYNAWIVEHGYIVTLLLMGAFLYPVVITRSGIYTSAALLTVFLGLIAQKLMESYSVGFLFWLILGNYFVRKRLDNG